MELLLFTTNITICKRWWFHYRSWKIPSRNCSSCKSCVLHFPGVYSYTADGFWIKMIRTSLSTPTGFDAIHVPSNVKIVVRLSSEHSSHPNWITFLTCLGSCSVD